MPDDIVKPKEVIAAEAKLELALEENMTWLNNEVALIESGFRIGGSFDQELRNKLGQEKNKRDAEDTKTILHAAWMHYNWSQEKEDAYQVQSVTKAINAVVGDTWYDLKLNNVRLDELRKADEANGKINVIVGKGGEVVSVTSAGKVTRHGSKEKPVGMTDADRTPGVRELEAFIQNGLAQCCDEVSKRGQKLADFIQEKVNANVTETDTNVTAIITDDQKRVIIANRKGAFEVVQVGEGMHPRPPAGFRPSGDMPIRIK